MIDVRDSFQTTPHARVITILIPNEDLVTMPTEKLHFLEHLLEQIQNLLKDET